MTYLQFIRDYLALHRQAPAEADMQAYFRVSPPSVHRMVVVLAEKGLITRVPGQARSIQLTPERARPQPTPTAEELESAANSLLQAAAAPKQRARAWAILSDPELESAAAIAGEQSDERRQYARWLRRQNDPRGELAHLLESGDPAAAHRHLKRHATLLFGEAARRVGLSHIVIDAWAFGLVERAHVRLDKVTPSELSAFSRCPAARFLASLTLNFTDETDNAITKVQAGRRKLEDAVATLRNAPCADSLRVLHVRSIDPSGQPAAVLSEKTVWARSALRSFRCLTDCRLTFDSEA